MGSIEWENWNLSHVWTRTFDLDSWELIYMWWFLEQNQEKHWLNSQQCGSQNLPKIIQNLPNFRSEKCEAILLGRPYQCPDPQMHLAENAWAVPWPAPFRSAQDNHQPPQCGGPWRSWRVWVTRVEAAAVPTISQMGMYQNQSCYIWGDEHPFTSYLGFTRVPRFWLIPKSWSCSFPSPFFEDPSWGVGDGLRPLERTFLQSEKQTKCNQWR